MFQIDTAHTAWKLPSFERGIPNYVLLLLLLDMIRDNIYSFTDYCMSSSKVRLNCSVACRVAVNTSNDTLMGRFICFCFRHSCIASSAPPPSLERGKEFIESTNGVSSSRIYY